MPCRPCPKKTKTNSVAWNVTAPTTSAPSTVPVQDTQMPAFTDLGKVTRDAKKLPCKTKPIPSHTPSAQDVNFMNMVNHIMRGGDNRR